MARTRSSRPARKRKATAVAAKGKKKAKPRPILDFRTTRSTSSALSWDGDVMDRTEGIGGVVVGSASLPQ